MLRKLYTFLLFIGQHQVYTHFTQYQKTQWFSRNELDTFRNKRLQHIVQTAYTFPFYKEKFDAAGITPADIRTQDDLKQLPIVTKHELKEALEQKTIGWHNSDSISYMQTTGSSGIPFSFPINKNAKADRMGGMLRTIEWYGHYLGTKNARLWRSYSKDFMTWLKQTVFGRRMDLSTFNLENPEESALTDEKIEGYLKQISRYKPKVIDGYVSAFVYIADYIIRNNITDFYAPTAIVTGAEYLSEESRSLIEKAFRCPVFNRYGGTEIGLMAHECEHGTMHVMDDKAFCELVDENGQPVQPGELGKVVFTDFTNEAMPFIRYEVGDMAIYNPSEFVCDCGRAFSSLQSITGRINDLMPLEDGSVIVSHIWFRLFRDFQEIKQFQVIQEDVDMFIIRIALVPPAIEVQQLLKDKIQEIVPDAVFHWEIVDSIEHGAGGKLRHTISSVPHHLNDIREEAYEKDAIELYPLSELKQHEEIDEEYLPDLVQHISDDGFLKKPIVIDAETKVIIDGHHRFNAAKQMGLQKIPALPIQYMHDDRIDILPFREDIPVSKQSVLEMASSGKVYPYKTTKHVFGSGQLPIVQCVPKIHVELESLR